MLTGVLKVTDIISGDSISGGTITGNVTINTNKPITTTDTVTAAKFIGDGSGLTNLLCSSGFIDTSMFRLKTDYISGDSITGGTTLKFHTKEVTFPDRLNWSFNWYDGTGSRTQTEYKSQYIDFGFDAVIILSVSLSAELAVNGSIYQTPPDNQVLM